MFGFVFAAVSAHGAKWTMLNAGKVSNTDEVAIARGANGVLHMIWRTDEGATVGLRHRSLSKDGKSLSPIVNVATGWDGLANPGLRIKADGVLQALFAGLGGPVPVNDGKIMGTEGGPGGGTVVKEGDWLSVIGSRKAIDELRDRYESDEP